MRSGLIGNQKSQETSDREKIGSDIVLFLKEIVEVDGVVDDREAVAIERVERILMKKSIREKLQKIVQ